MRLPALIFAAASLAFAAAVPAADSASGFIQDMPTLEPDQDRDGASIWRKPGADLGRYGKVAIGGLEIFIDPSSPYKGISADDVKTIADELRRSIIDTLEPEYPVVGTPGANVLVVRVAISNVLLKKKKRGLLSFTPAGFALTTMQEMAGGRTSLKNAAFEAELLDGESGERLAVLVDVLGKSVGKQEYSWDAVAGAAEFYAKRFRGRLDAAHGR